MSQPTYFPVHLPRNDLGGPRTALCGAEVEGTQLVSQPHFFQMVDRGPKLACTDCLNVLRDKGMPSYCRRCYHQRAQMYRRDDRILCSECLLDTLEHEEIVERIEVRSGR